MAKISVVIPVYNAEEFLNDSLSSVLNQTFDDIELICVNDGSKDNSLNILKKFAEEDERIKIIDQENAGCGAARNRALDEVSGDYIYFFDPDDYILPDAFERLYNNAKNNQSDIVLFKVAKFRDGEPIDYSQPGFEFEKDFPSDVNFEELSFNYKDVKRHVLNSAFAPWTKLYKSEFINSYDDFRFPVNLPFDDVPFHVKSMLRASRISFVPDYLYHYRLSNPNSVNNTSTNAIFIMDIIDMVEDFLKENNFFDEFIKEFYLFKVNQIFYYIQTANLEEYYQRARTELLKVREDMASHNLDDDILAKWHLEYFEFIYASNTLEEYKLNLKVNQLKKQNKKLKKQNKMLKKECNDLKKLNKEISGSKSWKITKPLRNIGNFKK